MNTRALLGFAACLLGCSTVVTVPGPDDDTDPQPEDPVDPIDEPESDWTVVSETPMTAPRDVMVGPDGKVTVAGLVQDGGLGCGVDRFDAEGNLLATDRHEVSGLGHPVNAAVGAAMGPNGEIVVLCQVDSGSATGAAWILWYDASGTFYAELEVESVVGMDIAYGAEPEQAVVVGADYRRGGGNALALYMGVTPQGVGPELGEGASVPENSSEARSMAPHPWGGNVVTKWELDPTGAVVESKLVWLEGPSFVEWVGEPCGPIVTVLSDGTIVSASNAVGEDEPAVLCRHTRDDGGVWTTTSSTFTLSASSYFGIVAMSGTSTAGEIVASGFSYPEDGSVDGEMFAVALGVDGSITWEDRYRGRDDAFAFGMALAVAGARVVQAGIETGTDEQIYRTVVRSLELP